MDLATEGDEPTGAEENLDRDGRPLPEFVSLSSVVDGLLEDAAREIVARVHRTELDLVPHLQRGIGRAYASGLYIHAWWLCGNPPGWPPFREWAHALEEAAVPSASVTDDVSVDHRAALEAA